MGNANRFYTIEPLIIPLSLTSTAWPMMQFVKEGAHWLNSGTLNALDASVVPGAVFNDELTRWRIE
ncbi:hypothetical protein Cpar_0917 [Chlorobaculum parvum NCIB 8327]|uniref:Uncharacterized protein n=1 Tax=Chlorobaculum parvum (strain DSM 263 / NCIMB 8327) TaxID=517417 RepID=B3QN26_CHLP8|nr:hypothetical protein Cpar_0917 [Chlorobaculum parvum NCIB 8327]